MKLFRYKADIIPTSLIIGLFLFDLAFYFYVDNIYVLISWMVLGLGPKACICSWNHHHQHLATFNYLIPNRILELIYAFHTGITTNAWVLHHVLGHHINYLDQEKDESGWKDSKGNRMSALIYTFTIAITGYFRAYQVGKKHRKFQKTFLSMGFFTIILLAIMFYYNWLNTVIIFLVPMLIGYIVTCWHTYYHHSGLESESHFEASYNIMHKWYNIFSGNLGYHTAHHTKMGLHWSKLPDFHKKIEDKIPKHLYKQACFPFTLLPDK